MLYVDGISGFFNLCTGSESSFRSLANETLRISESAKVVNLERLGPIPHNGYRALDNSALLSIFPDYKFLKYSDFIDRMINEAGLTNGN
jgi:hypothetical protein